MDPKDNPNPSPRPVRRRRGLWLLAAVSVALVASIGAVRAYAIGGGFGWRPGASPEQRKAFMERRLDRALTLVKASDSQRTAIKAIFERAFTELQPIHQEHRRLHDDLVAAFAADPVDRAAVEKLRTETTGLVDRGSQVLTKALLDAAGVLTPDQRKTLIEHMQELHGRGHGQGGW